MPRPPDEGPLTDAERDAAASLYPVAAAAAERALSGFPPHRREWFQSYVAVSLFQSVRRWRPDGGLDLEAFVRAGVYRTVRGLYASYGRRFHRELTNVFARRGGGNAASDAGAGGLTEDVEPAAREDRPREDAADAALEALRAEHPAQYRIVAMRYGLDGGGGLSFTEIGRILGVSKQAASHAERAALRKLRAWMA